MNVIVNFPLLVFGLSFVVLMFSAKAGDVLRKKMNRVQEDMHDFGEDRCLVHFTSRFLKVGLQNPASNSAVSLGDIIPRSRTI